MRKKYVTVLSNVVLKRVVTSENIPVAFLKINIITYAALVFLNSEHSKVRQTCLLRDMSKKEG